MSWLAHLIRMLATRFGKHHLMPQEGYEFIWKVWRLQLGFWRSFSGDLEIWADWGEIGRQKTLFIYFE